MVPSIRERERDWGGEQGKQGVKKKIGIRSGMRKAESKVGGVEQGEKHRPWGVYPPALHSFCHFSCTAIFAARRQGGRLFLSTVPPISLVLSPQCCYLNPLVLPKQPVKACRTAPGSIPWHGYARWARTNGTSHLPLTAERR